jgi:hypothetical protein
MRKEGLEKWNNFPSLMFEALIQPRQKKFELET